MTTTHPVAIPTHVRIRNTDPNRRDCHAADAIVCRADRLADALLESGWFAVLPDLIAPELQRALLAGRCTDGMERTLDISIENLSEGSATLPDTVGGQAMTAAEQQRARVRAAAAVLPGESWSASELHALADFLDSIIAARRRVATTAGRPKLSLGGGTVRP